LPAYEDNRCCEPPQVVPGRPIGFIGLGTMGAPMALNLLRSGHPLLVYNRTACKTAPLVREGAAAAASAAELIEACETIILMLADDRAIDAVLDRGSPRFAGLVAGRTIIHMGTTLPAHSKALQADILAGGGRYVEAPVSGSRGPAERGELIGMLAGEVDTLDAVRPLIAPLCRTTVDCGPAPNALLMKLAVNVFLVAQVAALAEAVNFAASHAVDVAQLLAILDVGPMASEVSKAKAAILRSGDRTAQASIANVAEVCRLITSAGRGAGAPMPLLAVCQELYSEALAAGHGEEDMIAVIDAFADRRSGPLFG
jgi:3-hydroxyisobutyrate dehydrogenase